MAIGVRTEPGSTALTRIRIRQPDVLRMEGHSGWLAQGLEGADLSVATYYFQMATRTPISAD
jgi:hypothetical protein